MTEHYISNYLFVISIIFARFLNVTPLVFIIACFIIVGIQIFFLTFFLISFGKSNTDPEQIPHGVSVIVCAHDEEDNLRQLIPLLLKQEHPAFEIIIVEDRSNDGTYDYLLQATMENPLLKMVRVVHKPEHINGKKFGLTLGIKAAKYNWVCLTDADCRPSSSQWLKGMTGHYQDNTRIVIGFSPYLRSSGLLNSFIRFESLVTAIQYIGLALMGRPYMGVGRNLAYEKSLFLDNKGFNKYLNVMGGDDDLFVNQHAQKNNTTVSIGSEVLTVSIPKKSWKAYYYQKLRHLTIGKRYRIFDKIILGLFSLSWVLVWFMVLPFMITSSWIYWMMGLMLFRWVLLIFLLHSAGRKLGQGFEVWKVPFLDFIYAFYYLVTGAMALAVKKIRWKV